ncbi:hypothetical protein DM860_016687 [Cuscuta australis]|uniref:Uncharacterized protein n=1 Tax=Cuscuta australis TaxID=267555 RepID=A0A328DKY7_9ASTE|nr:hypothetical protein DM860_016687 [Cuscuta australis]
MSTAGTPGSPNDELEEEVNQMAEKLADYRAAVLDKLNTNLPSILASTSLVVEKNVDFGSQFQPGPSHPPDFAAVESEAVGSLRKQEQDEAEKLQLLKEKFLSNANAVSSVSRKMKEITECMEKIDKLEPQNGVIHRAFKRKRE